MHLSKRRLDGNWTQPSVSMLMFYDGPNPPEGYFDDFLKIPADQQDVKSRPFLDLVQSAPSSATAGLRYVA